VSGVGIGVNVGIGVGGCACPVGSKVGLAGAVSIMTVASGSKTTSLGGWFKKFSSIK
jgi:hypothetical protein